MAIPGCQLDYIWNELQSRIGKITSDTFWRLEIEVSDLDLGMEILRHSGYGFQKIKTGRSPSSRSSGIATTPLLWATPSAGDHVRTLEEGSIIHLLAVWD